VRPRMQPQAILGRAWSGVLDARRSARRWSSG